MDELEIGGRRYISTKRAGKDHKYHSDYIGQLIRGKKVVGQKVGRAWYVDVESLEAYFNNEGATFAQVAVAPASIPVVKQVVKQEVVEAPVIAVAAKPVEPVIAPAPTPVVEKVAEPIQVNKVFEVEVAKAPEPIVAFQQTEKNNFYVKEKFEPIQTSFDENKISLHIAQAQPSKNVEYVEEHAPVQREKKGLVYFSDNEPTLPPIRKRNFEVHAAPIEREVEREVEQPVAVIPREEKEFEYVQAKKFPIGRIFVLTFVVVAAVAGVTYASTKMSSVVTVEDGKPAIVQFSFK
jgi:hypothetical protein